MVSVAAAFGQGGGTPAAIDDTWHMNFVTARMSPYMADAGASSQIPSHGIRRRDFAAPCLKACRCTTNTQRPMLGLIDIAIPIEGLHMCINRLVLLPIGVCLLLLPIGGPTRCAG